MSRGFGCRAFDMQEKERRHDVGALDDSSAGMARVGAVIAPVDAVLRPTGFRVRHGLLATDVRSQTDLISCQWHEGASRGGVMHLVIAVGLGVLVDDEVRQSASPEIDSSLVVGGA